MSSSYIIYTDGGARGNPGPAAAAFVILNQQQRLVYKGGQYLGETTNNVAEYEGVRLSLNYIIGSLSPPPHTSLTYYLDSLLVCEQLSGHYKIKQPHLLQLATSIHQLIYSSHFEVTFQAIPRAKNTLADAEVNRLLDAAMFSR